MQLPFYLHDVMGASASRSGLAIALMSGAYALASTQYGRVASRLDHSEVLAVACALVGTGYLLIWLASGWTIMLLGLLMAGIGQGLLSPNMSLWLADATPAALRGRVLGGLTTTVFLGIFLSPIVGQPVGAAIGFRRLCLSGGALLLVMASLFWVVRNQLRSLAGCTRSEQWMLDTGTGETEVVGLPDRLDEALALKMEAREPPVKPPSRSRCAGKLQAAH
jgi:MFS family permease